MNTDEYRKGLASVLLALIIWGFMAIYWPLLTPINSWVIVLYRIFTVFIFSLIAARMKYSFREIFAPLKEGRNFLIFTSAGAVSAINWGLYIYAVNSGHIVQASTGYYIEPLMICLIGNIVFKEKFNKYNLTAIGMATFVVIMLFVHFGELPSISLLLALTFSIYTTIKKATDLPPRISLVYETMILSPVAFAVIVYLELTGRGAFAIAQPWQFIPLLLSGLATLIPFLFFSYGAQRISMFQIGLSEYVGPTISLILGLTLMGESVDKVQVIGFLIIWTGLAIFSIGEYKEYKNNGNRAE